MKQESGSHDRDPDDALCIIDGVQHEVGNPDCPQCWGTFWPRRCRCGGRVHAGFVDESWDNVILGYACDVCGDAYQEEED